jgi:hypothetical protein
MTVKEASPINDENDCEIPPAIPKAELHKLVMAQSEHEHREISDYINWQCNKKRELEIEKTGSSEIAEEVVEHAEKIKSERVWGVDYDVWDVHTNLTRWWVITSPTNLYSQKLMPSLDYTLSFHIGLMARVDAQRAPNGDETTQELLLVTSRKIFQAQEAFDAADEAEDFQAIGLLCREALTSFTREIVAAGMVSDIAEAPKLSDFPGWADQVIGARAAGGSAEYIRGYLKSVCQKGWQLANWLTHAKNATREDARLALSATEHIVDELTGLVLKALTGAPERCGKCGSHRISVTWRPDEGEAGEYVARCEVCGAEKTRREADPSNKGQK